MKDKIEDIKTEVEEKSSDFTSHKDQKGEIRKDLEDLISDCEQLYNDYDKARMQVRKKNYYSKTFSQVENFNISRFWN